MYLWLLGTGDFLKRALGRGLARHLGPWSALQDQLVHRGSR